MAQELATRPKNEVGNRRQWQGQPAQEIDADEAKQEVLATTSKDLYKVYGSNKSQPTVNIVRRWAYTEKVSDEILICEKTSEYVKVRVRAWLGPREAPIMVREQEVLTVFKDQLRLAIVQAIVGGVTITYKENGQSVRDYIERPAFEIDDNGYPRLLDNNAMLAILKTHLEYIYKAERVATGHAQRRVFLELMGPDKAKQIKADDPEEDPADDDQEDEHTSVSREAETVHDVGPSLDELKDKIVAKAKASVGGDKEAAILLFTQTCKTLGLSHITSTKDIKTVEYAQLILEKIPESMFSSEGSEESQTGNSSAGGPSETNATQSPAGAGENNDGDSVPWETEDELTRLKAQIELESKQVAFSEVGKKEFKGRVELAIRHFLVKAKIPNASDLGSVTSVAQAEAVLQCICDYHFGGDK
jgi:hypothetical protein